MMAPVGREVLLVSGLYGEQGAFLPKQPVQWTLTPDSVGHFLDVSDPRDCLDVFRPASDTRTETFIVTKTSSKSEVITRGTPSPADDISVLSGQSWVSVTSPTEGSSHISVLAPDAENWDQRRQTATIYWVDVQWVLPAPAMAMASQPHTLTTIIRRSSGKPAPGWIVRYEIGDANVTGCADGSQRVLEATSNENGMASVNLVAANKNEQVRILCKIIRPVRLDDDLPRMVVGQGWTTVTWSASDPTVTISGPPSAGIGSTVTYAVRVTNLGDLAARQVVASTRIPPNMTFLRSDPPAQVIGDQLSWELGDLAPGQVRPLSISCRPERNASVRFCVRVQSADQAQGTPMSAEACVATRVFSSSLALQVNGPEQAQVGERVTFEIEVKNSGYEPMNRVVIRDRLAQGLEHASESGSLIEKTLDAPLAPGASRKIAVELIVRGTGRLTHTITAFAEAGHSATATATIQGVAPPPPPKPDPRPEVQVKIEGPNQGQVGEKPVFGFTISNTGNVPLTNIRLVNSFDPSLVAREASGDFDRGALQRNELVWIIDRLAPGQAIVREAMYELLQPSADAWSRLTVVTAEGARTTEDARIQITPRSQHSRPGEPPIRIEEQEQRKPERVVGELKVAIADSRDPIRQGSVTTYLIDVQNNRNAADKDVVLTIILPPGMRYESFRGIVGAKSISGDGRTVEINPVRELRAGENVGFRLEVRGEAVGNRIVTVRVNSWLSGQPVEASEDTTINVSG